MEQNKKRKILKSTLVNFKAQREFTDKLLLMNKKILYNLKKLIFKYLTDIKFKDKITKNVKKDLFSFFNETSKILISQYQKKVIKYVDEFVRKSIASTLFQIEENLYKNKLNLGYERKVIDDTKKEIMDNVLFYVLKIPEKYVSNFDKIILSVITDLLKLEEKDLEKDLIPILNLKLNSLEKKTDYHATLISTDQSFKIVSLINEKRYIEAGIDKYIWSTREDLRVVGNPIGLYPIGTPEHGDHWIRDKKVFSFKHPPHDGSPGWAIGCRCIAFPIIEE